MWPPGVGGLQPSLPRRQRLPSPESRTNKKRLRELQEASDGSRAYISHSEARGDALQCDGAGSSSDSWLHFQLAVQRRRMSERTAPASSATGRKTHMATSIIECT